MGANTKYFVLGAALIGGGLFAAAVSDLVTFNAGQVIKSSEVNSNFSILKSAVAALEAPVDTSRLADGAVTLSKISIGGTAADGRVLKLQGGALTWSDDLTGGSGGTAYTAGSGLSLVGTTFSVADGGVTASKLSATGGADGKVLKLSGGNLTWADDQTGGSGGTTYTADGTSLQLVGTTFSVKDGGITAAKLADGSVSGAKLAASLTTSGVTFTNNANAGFSFALRTQAGGSAGLSLTTPVGLVSESQAGTGIAGGSQSGIGIQGSSQTSIAVRGQGAGGAGLTVSGPIGVLGESSTGTGIIGGSASGIAILGRSGSRGIVGTQGSLVLSCPGTYAIGGCSENNGIGVYGTSPNSSGVYGNSTNYRAVEGQSTAGIGVLGNSNARGVVGTLDGTSCRGDLTYAVGGCAPSGTGYSAVFVGGAGGAGSCMFSGGAGWNCTSDQNKKENFSSVDNAAVLEALARMPVTRWNMKGDLNKTPHIGPVAQDFYSAFGVGDNNTTINTADAQGVALAAIKGLYQKNKALEAENRAVRAKMADLEQQLSELKTLAKEVAQLKAQLKQ